VRDVDEISLDIRNTGGEAAEGGELLRDARSERRRGRVFDVAQEMLDADLFCFFCIDGRWCMEECFACFCAIL
jgi:hypothetical protein